MNLGFNIILSQKSFNQSIENIFWQLKRLEIKVVHVQKNLSKMYFSIKRPLIKIIY